jgi:hypothetical protein
MRTGQRDRYLQNVPRGTWEGGMIELNSLVGARQLSGVDFESQEVEGCWGMETAEVCRFCLDGEIYVAVQNPSDGYRSSMRELVRAPSDVMKNSFAPVPVFCLHRESSGYDAADILEVYDIKTAKLVLRVGTDRTDDYYPTFIASFTPENMAPNA